jgi:hypothetical protein
MPEKGMVALAVEMSVRGWVACNAWGVGLKVENMPSARPRPAGRPLTSINKASTRRIQAACFRLMGQAKLDTPLAGGQPSVLRQPPQVCRP